jgi:poly-gamma-glutamate capsule biosynthesis protein CapA/YwtB (metallophosphatase superfamily)
MNNRLVKCSWMTWVGLAGAALLGVAPVATWAALPVRGGENPPESSSRLPGLAMASGEFRLVTVGDLLYSHPFASNADAKLQKVFSLLRSGDVVIGNKEGVFFDLRDFKGSGRDGGLLWGEAALASDMKAMGIGMVSVANNHSMDWGWQGLSDCLRLLDAAGIVYGGAGRNLQEAREAGFMRTAAGVVALVATASTYSPNAGADDAFGDAPSRPGISILRLQEVNSVTSSQMSLIRRLAKERASAYEPAPAPDAREVSFGGELYRVSRTSGVHYEMNRYDLAGLVQAVRAAKRKANLVVFTIHAHETATGNDDDNPQPPDFLIRLAHDVIDAGADVFLGTGIHDLRGIEIYHGRPVFYGMSSFFINGEVKELRQSMLQAYEGTSHQHASRVKQMRSGPVGCFQVRSQGDPRSWFDSMVAVTDFDRGRASEVRIYPLDLGDTCDQSRRGIPHFADPADARRILVTLQRYSAPFGTRIDIRGSVGLIRIR